MTWVTANELRVLLALFAGALDVEARTPAKAARDGKYMMKVELKGGILDFDVDGQV